MLAMPARAELQTALEQQLLVQLGERLRRARKDRGISSVELAKQVGISRTTLRAVELGDPSPTFGTYVRVLSALGLAGDLALLATGTRQAARIPAIPTDLNRHGAQDLQSLLMHQEAVRLLREDPALVTRVEQTLARWMQRDDPNSLPLLKRWARIVTERDWDAA
jgi:transcriptional regulator with XRE-family HTH domain